YAYGLVFAAQSETDSAIGKFRESAKLAKLPHLAALSQVAILELTLGNRDAALDACREVAEGVLRPPDAWPGHDARVRIAEGLGQIVGYLDGESASVPRELAELRNSIETKFPADLKSAFQSTATAVSTRRRDLRDLAARSREEQSAESKRQSESAKRTMEETNEIRERIEKQLRDLTKPHQEDLKQVLGELRQRSAKLKSEELGARQFAAAVQNLSQPRLYPNNQVRVSRRGRASSSRSNAWRKENATERKQREQRLKAAKEKLESSLTQVRSLQQEVARGRSRRKELESQFTDSSRELKKELNAARLKHQAAEKELRDASAVEQNPEGTKQRADAPATYLAVDVKTLAEEVLASLDSAADHH
ncbi:MAG: hypothetical protein NT069_28525, partial [Planctomycetota bacterium]|nr:hypothetical protein [Planctomycetota bacterium]